MAGVNVSNDFDAEEIDYCFLVDVNDYCFEAKDIDNGFVGEDDL